MAGQTKILTFSEGVSVSAPAQSFLSASTFQIYASIAEYETAKGSAGTLGNSFANSTDGFLYFHDGTNWQTVDDRKNNFTAVVDPTAGDDTDDNYQVGSIWINTNDSTIFIATDVTALSAVWLQVGRAIIGKREDFTGDVDGIEVNFSIGFTPVDDTILVLRNGLILPDTEFSYAHPVVTLNTAPALGSNLEIFYLTNGSPAITQIRTDQRVENRTISAGEVTAKQLTLAATPIEPTEVLIDVSGGTAQIYGTDFIVSGAVVDWDGYSLEGQISAGSKLRIVYYTQV